MVQLRRSQQERLADETDEQRASRLEQLITRIYQQERLADETDEQLGYASRLEQLIMRSQQERLTDETDEQRASGLEQLRRFQQEKLREVRL